MKQEIFIAQNELEKLVVNALDGGVEEDEFMSTLIQAQVYMPIQDETNTIKGFQSSTKAQPLLVKDDNGTQVLILFTSQSRAKDFVANHSGYGSGLLTELSWVLRKMDAPLAISLNPGYETGFDMEAEMVAELIDSLPPETASPSV